MKRLSVTDIMPEVQPGIFTQDYGKKRAIDGVVIVDKPIMAGEDGTFEEIIKVTDPAMFDGFPSFDLKQINRSIVLPGAVKAWHLHFNQEDIWYVPPQEYVLLGLYDVREGSPTRGHTQKIVMGAGKSRSVYIPRGVAHGAANVSHKEAQIIYFVNQAFDLHEPDEKRLPWDILGEEFWAVEKG